MPVRRAVGGPTHLPRPPLSSPTRRVAASDPACPAAAGTVQYKCPIQSEMALTRDAQRTSFYPEGVSYPIPQSDPATSSLPRCRKRRRGSARRGVGTGLARVVSRPPLAQ